MSAAIYILSVYDRHSGTYPYVYAEKANAIARAENETAEAEEHYGRKAERTLLPGNIFRAHLEDCFEVTVEESKLEDVEE